MPGRARPWHAWRHPRTMKLLIIDDHAGARQLIREIVARPGDRVCECATGEEALAVAPGFGADFATVDLMLGGVSGFATMRALQQQSPGTRLVVVSSYSEPELRLAALALGAVAFVPKERLTELREVVHP